MTGAILASLAGGGGGGSDVTPAPLDWTDAFGDIIAHTNSQTITGITTPISLAAGASGGGNLHYSLNGGSAGYLGAFAVAAGNTLIWSILNTGTAAVSGTVTITNVSDGGATLDSFNYTATGVGP